jgi:hypothetical protein
MAHYQFKKDMNDGEKGERLLIKYLTTNYGMKFIGKSPPEEFKFWDLKFNTKDDTEVTYEVKTDVYVAKGKTLPNGYVVKGFDTGNIFIEFETRGKESGIKVTKADWWVYIFYYLGEIWFIKVSDLKQLIEDNNFEIKDNNVGDHNSETKGIVIPREKFRNKFIVKLFDISN